MKDDDNKPGVLPRLTPQQKRACESAELVMDNGGRTAIALRQTKDEVAYIPMSDEGVFMMHASPSNFRKRYPLSQRDPKSPRSLQASNAERAARCYVTHATYSGADESALRELESLVPITKQEKEKIAMASSNKKKGPTTGGDKDKEPKARKPAAAADGKKTTPAAPKEKRVTSASTFRELIMKGGLTDDQIFAEVRKRHPDVTPDKRKYVAWYRNHLKKEGENPPAPKRSPKEDAE